MHLESKEKNNTWLNSFHGLKSTFQNEFSIYVVTVSAIVWIVFGIFYSISHMEWLFSIFILGFMFAVELLNTSLEAVVDLVSPEIHPLAKIAKDTASAAEGIASFLGFLIFLCIFLPKIFGLL